MEKPPMEWIDKLFNCMIEFYGERWEKMFSKTVTVDLAKAIWQSGLQGLTYEEIRDTLVYLKRRASQNYAQPPNHLDFHRIAKNEAKAVELARSNAKRPDPEIARRALDEIRSKLHGDNSLEGKTV